MALALKRKAFVAFMLLELFEDGFKRGKKKQRMVKRTCKKEVYSLNQISPNREIMVKGLNIALLHAR